MIRPLRPLPTRQDPAPPVPTQSLMRRAWSRLANPRIAVAALALPPAVILTTTAITEHDIVPAIAAAGIVGTGAIVGGLLAPLLRKAHPGDPGVGQRSGEAHVPVIAASFVLAVLLLRGVPLALSGLPPGEALRYAVDIIPGMLSALLLASGLLSVALLVAPPVDAVDTHAKRVAMPPLLRSRTIAALAMLASLAVGTFRLVPERWVPGRGPEPGKIAAGAGAACRGAPDAPRDAVPAWQRVLAPRPLP